ncbi:MarR family winged helix-turn-helix transcriptional regulator [Cellulomonas humilata]|uniref:DNA-binding MarR family transcriptional regulator n=1 Tax=Cellulomonas humilata TaxID=144055 RepID=A0ABU0E9X2_9CELL|nr:MarR family transcriptional regulator [Cellulomonas humilata]MDQ0371918.1 DNA-binding MarR family transcriptional regulator [Cellulomonas humilata]
MQSTTFPEDDLRRFIQQIARSSGFLESVQRSHEHAGVRLSVSETFALGELAEAGALSQQELAARLGLEKSTVSRLAAGMEERGWLSRERDADDRRLYRLQLTAVGRDVAERVGAELSEHHSRLLARLSHEERHALGVGLGALVRELDATHQEHGHH